MELDFDKMNGLVPAIIQDNETRKVLMLGFMNKEAYDKTVETGKVTFFSRTKNIDKRHEEMPEGSYTTSLFESGINKIAQKVGEEAVETVIEATNGTDERLIYEGADLIYHMIVLLASKGYRIEDLARELQERHSSTWKKH